MFDWLRKIFHKDAVNNITSDVNDKPFDNQKKFIWCFIGNIIDEHNLGTNQQMKNGIKHFSPNTKVYCFPTLWGDRYENIKVIGKHRKTNRNVYIVVPSKLITA